MVLLLWWWLPCLCWLPCLLEDSWKLLLLLFYMQPHKEIPGVIQCVYIEGTKSLFLLPWFLSWVIYEEGKLLIFVMWLTIVIYFTQSHANRKAGKELHLRRNWAHPHYWIKINLLSVVFQRFKESDHQLSFFFIRAYLLSNLCPKFITESLLKSLFSRNSLFGWQVIKNCRLTCTENLCSTEWSNSILFCVSFAAEATDVECRGRHGSLKTGRNFLSTENQVNCTAGGFHVYCYCSCLW